MKCWYVYGVECNRKGDCEGCEVIKEWEKRRDEIRKREEEDKEGE